MEKIKITNFRKVKETKSKLELEIEGLKSEKQALEDKMEIYRQIQSKKDEIKNLMQKLEEE